MKNTPNNLEGFRKEFEDEYDIKYTDEEAQEAFGNIVGFFEVLHKIHCRLVKEGRMAPFKTDNKKGGDDGMIVITENGQGVAL